MFMFVYSFADWYDFHNNVKDVPREDIFDMVTISIYPSAIVSRQI